jgi:hypothetical protein
MSKPEERKKARELRIQGWRIVDIASELDTHKDVIIEWCRDIKLTDEQIASLSEDDILWAAQHKGAQVNSKIGLHRRLQYQEVGREQTRNGSLLHLIGCMLYWGEGAKHRQQLRFTNTDPDMLKLFVSFLRLELNVPDEKIILRVMTHSENQDEWLQIQEYWLDFLEFPKDTKVAMQQKIGTKSRKTRYPHGICAIDVYSTEVVQKIFGAIQEYIGFENPKWVE